MMNFKVDAHFDLGGIIYNRRKKGQRRILEEAFYEDLHQAGFKLIIAAIFIETDMTDLALREGLLQIEAIKADILESDHFTLITNRKELEALKFNEKIGIIMSLEGAEPIHRSLDLLKTFFTLGVRGLGLVWSRRNFVADGSYFRNPEEGIRGGLTPFGIEVVRLAEQLGMFIDVSHLNDQGLEDVLRYTKFPVIASHSNARHLNNITRNLTDDQIREIADRGGVIGANAYIRVVSMDEELQTIERLCDHIMHILNQGGAKSVGFGFDFCTPYYDNGRQLDVMENYRQTAMIVENLMARGLESEIIEQVVGGNWYQYLLSRLPHH